MIPPIVSNHPVTRLTCVVAGFISYWSIPTPTSSYWFGGFDSRILLVLRDAYQADSNLAKPVTTCSVSPGSSPTDVS